MERITINISTRGAAFYASPATEIASVLRGVAAAFEAGGPSQNPDVLLDSDGVACGNVVGVVSRKLNK